MLGPSIVSGWPQQNNIDKPTPAIGKALAARASLPDLGSRKEKSPPTAPAPNKRMMNKSTVCYFYCATRRQCADLRYQ
jgi:hypothetical protein